MTRFLFFAMLFMASSVFAMPMPANMSKVEIYLLTTDVGDPLYAKFGHTAVRVKDDSDLTDQVYNLGTFDDSDPLFGINFYRGDLYYEMSDYPMRVAVRNYRREGRTVWQDRVNLTDSEKRIFLEKLVWQSKPENFKYLYLYFFDNCSTRIRDFFDLAIDGALKKDTFNTPSPDTFRAVVRSHMYSSTEVAMFLDIIMNNRLDRLMSQWEEMFLPMRLRAHMKSFRKADGQPLLVEEEVIYEGKLPDQDNIHAYFWFVGIIGFPLVVLWLFTLKLSRVKLQLAINSQKIPGLLRVSFGLVGAWFGGMGLLMTCNWLLSHHLDLHHNANLWIFFPLDLVFLWSSFRPQFFLNNLALIKKYSITRVAMISGLAIAQVVGIVAQDVLRIALSFGIVGIAIFATTLIIEKGDSSHSKS